MTEHETINTLSAEQQAMLKAKGRAATPVPRAPSNGAEGGVAEDAQTVLRALTGSLKAHREEINRRLEQYEATSVKDALKAVRKMEGEEGAQEQAETAAELRAAAQGDQFRVVKWARAAQGNKFVSLGVETAKVGVVGYIAYGLARVGWAWLTGSPEDIVEAAGEAFEG